MPICRRVLKQLKSSKTLEVDGNGGMHGTTGCMRKRGGRACQLRQHGVCSVGFVSILDQCLHCDRPLLCSQKHKSCGHDRNYFQSCEQYCVLEATN